jgi:2-keto-4-pentenoate hydratase
LEEELGGALAEARRAGRLTAIPANWPPAALDAAERIRDAATAAMGEPVAGWKIGATSPEAQQIMGCDGPFFGPLFASRIHESGATVAFTPGTLGVECEFAFRIASDQPAGRADYDAGSLAGLVASCHPALEIVGRRVGGEGFPNVTGAVADFALNVAFVHGPAIPRWREADLAAAEVKGFVGDEQTNAGHGRNVLGHPLNALAWLANALAARGGGLKAGDWVSTGTCLGVVKAAPGARIRGEYGPLGRVEVHFAA